MGLVEMITIVRSLYSRSPDTLARIVGLYKQYAAASSLTKDDIKRCYREFDRTGAVPLGWRKDEGEKWVAWWLIYDETRFSSDSILYDALRAMTPPGVGLKIIRL